jgi:curved DNA-binding protein CbpA
MAVAWRSGNQQGVSRLGTVSMGGLYLKTPNPPSTDSPLELLIDVTSGVQVRARAVVRNSQPGKGMGVKFVHMGTEDRSRLNQFLKAQLDAGNIQEDLFAAASKEASSSREFSAGGSAPSSSTSEVGSASSYWHSTAEIPKAAPPTRTAEAASTPNSTANEPCGEQPKAEGNANAAKAEPQKEEPKAESDEVTAVEMERYLALAEKGNYYQLLGISSDAGSSDVKKGFYALARKFHPDRHMNRPEWVKPLQQLMGAITVAHNTLSDEKARGAYDRKLIQRKTEAEATLEECEKLAVNAIRDKNVEGAIFWGRKCVTFAPEVAKYRFQLASHLALLPHYHREAVEHFQKGTELDPWNTAGYLQFGELFELMKLPWRAAALYSKVLELDPGNAAARQRLARAQGKEKKNKKPVVARLFSRKD